jgi:hypothetical protein
MLLPRIAPVEDNNNDIHMITRRLRQQSCEVIVAKNDEVGMTMTPAEPHHITGTDVPAHVRHWRMIEMGHCQPDGTTSVSNQWI